MPKYVIAIDQSTQGTKAMLFDEAGELVLRTDKGHKQIVNELGWVEHNPEEIYENTIAVVKALLEKSKVAPSDLSCVGISNQRETALAWSRSTGKSVYNAIVWQCARGEAICKRIADAGKEKEIKGATGLQLSPYFSAAKLAWIMQYVNGVREQAMAGEICCGTMDSWLIYKLTKGKEFRTDYSNASRTQLFHLTNLCWDESLCKLFGIPKECLAQVTDSDGYFGETDFDGLLERPIPIHGVFGDSHGALYGQGCLEKGMMKTTYGTGSSIMMNVGETPIFSDLGVVSSLAWKTKGKVQYVLEGNINYTGAVITWIKDQLGLIEEAGETEDLARQANPADRTYLVPGFTGLGAPYWRSDVSAMIYGMTRTTGKAEIVKAGLSSIAYQIADIVSIMKEAASIEAVELRVDGGPTKNKWLMQFQSDILDSSIYVPKAEELSGIGAAYAAGIGAGIYCEDEIFASISRTKYLPKMNEQERKNKYEGWKNAVNMVLNARMP